MSNDPTLIDWADGQILVWLKIGTCTKTGEVFFLRIPNVFDAIPAGNLVEAAALLRVLAEDCDDSARAKGPTG